MYDLIVFDLGGTVVNTRPALVESIVHALKGIGVGLAGHVNVEDFLGSTVESSIRNICGLDNSELKPTVNVAIDHFDKKGFLSSKLYDGVIDVLQELKSRGFKIALLSFDEHVFTRNMLVHFGIESYFDFASDTSAPKPGERNRSKTEIVARLLQEAAADFGRSDIKALVIGDKGIDIEAAIANKVDSVGVLWGFGGINELEKVDATKLVSSMEELLEFIIDA